MDFPQQIEETLVERAPTVYDVVMESPLCFTMERSKPISRSDAIIPVKKNVSSSNLYDKMNSSVNSTLDDTTPSDSGVQMLDSEASELMVESITSQNGFSSDFDELKSVQSNSIKTPQHTTHQVQSQEEIQELRPIKVEQLSVNQMSGNQQASSVYTDTNSNVTTTTITTSAAAAAGVDEVMTASAYSTFDTTENIVFRRKARKTPAASNKTQKKRVSFHEDILKNTRTDNIHIEHGFITYKNGRKMPTNFGAGRYSWCSGSGSGQTVGAGGASRHAELCAEMSPDDDDINGACEGAGAGSNSRRRGRVYRNACSDVLDYGNSDIYDTNQSNGLQYDSSGVFEYLPRQAVTAAPSTTNDNTNAGAQPADATLLYRCSCSSSNSSLDSDENDKNSNRQQQKTTNYARGQCKSSSCDCVLGSMSNSNNNFIGENCYFSEPNIDNLNDAVFKKSVWNKEKKPKSSCLKKTKYHTNIIQEQDLSTKMKKFNVHDMNQLLDNSSKMLFGSLKSIFTMPLPERGVPEGSEDLQPVIECLSELEQQTPEHKLHNNNKQNNDRTTSTTNGEESSPTSPILKAKPFLSKSLDGTKAQQGVKKFVHNVDEQLRRKNTEEMYAASHENSAETTKTKTPLQRQTEFEADLLPTHTTSTFSPPSFTQFRNKFIVNCESTVFEHTGVSYEANQIPFYNAHNAAAVGAQFDVEEEEALVVAAEDDSSPFDKSTTLIAQPESALYSTPIAKTFTNFFRSFKEATTPSTSATTTSKITDNSTQKKEYDKKFVEKRLSSGNCCALKSNQILSNPNTTIKQIQKPSSLTTATSSSTISSELSSTSTTSLHAQYPKQHAQIQKMSSSIPSNSLVLGQDLRSNIDKQSRHLASPLKKRSSTIQPQRYGCTTNNTNNSIPNNVAQNENNLLAVGSDAIYNPARGGYGRDSKSTILSEEFDDILTITTDTDKNESDIVIVDYPTELNDMPSTSTASSDYGTNLLKPPAAKTSLINRFLRNVTQKKILETSMRRNNFFASKLKSEQKLLTGQLYVRGVRGPKNYELIDDLNAEIAMEIEMSGANSPRRELTSINSSDLPGDASRFELGIGEISIDIFNGNYLHILRDQTEQLMKVFKLYTGYSREGYMTPVLVFLTDKTLYVTDLVRNRLCSKFVLAYIDLDVILLGPSGNTVLLSNSERDMQQVLLAGGPYPADGLVANLELCARRSGSILPAVGQLTLEHLAPLRAFVREHSCVGRNDEWMYYAVVNVPAGSLGNSLTIENGGEKEPLGPHVKGFLMHRRIKGNIFSNITTNKQGWNPGYFLLKAGVLYMFNDSMQKLPSWAMALAECQGARRAVKAGRPFCFEIMLRGGELFQMAAPDEYVASEWLQALLQSASGLFEMQEKHKTLGCTLVVTQNHLITLREDFTAPLRKICKNTNSKLNSVMRKKQQIAEILPSLSGAGVADTGSLISSAKSSPTKVASSSVNSTPTKMSQNSRSTTTSNTITSPTTASTSSTKNIKTTVDDSESVDAVESYTNMSSVYGKNSGLEILSCADIKEMTGIKIPSHNDTWWCILEFSCQEVCESSDDLVIFFASSAEMQRFLRLLEQLWQAKNNDLFPITVLDEEDIIAEQCTMLYMDINRSWEPLLSAALGYPL